MVADPVRLYVEVSCISHLYVGLACVSACACRVCALSGWRLVARRLDRHAKVKEGA